MPQQGAITLKLDSADGQPLDFGSERDDKLLAFPVVFPQIFAATPLVHLGVIGMHAVAVNQTNWKPDLGFDLRAVDVQAAGFTLRVQLQWFNTARTVTVSWIAFEP